MKILITSLLMIFIFFSPTIAFSKCMNTENPSCGVYQTCFAKLCNCDNSEFEYFISYGKKYCEVFLDLPGLSQKGKDWRNSTLKCLQETIVPLLPKDGEENSCNCKDMQIKAFDSHIACYTKESNSICNLEPNDWLLILKAVEPVASLKDHLRRKQMLETAKICLPIAAERARSTIQQLIDKLN